MVGKFYHFKDIIKKCEAYLAASFSAIGITGPIPEFKDHKLIMPEEEPPCGAKLSLSEALE